LAARVDVPLTDNQAMRGEFTFRRYSDENEQSAAYLQYQRSRSLGAGTWVAVQPHFYIEQWRSQSPAYFSPDQQVSTGLTLRAIVERGLWTLDMAVSPQALITDGRGGAGLTFVGGGRARIGGGSVGASVMVFDDHRHAYNLRRFTADLRIPIGK
jgi:hypothetical protein